MTSASAGRARSCRRSSVIGTERGAADVAGGKLGSWADVQDLDLAPLQSGCELIATDDIDPVALAEVSGCQALDARDVLGGDVADRGPELCHPLAGEGVVDAGAVATGGDQPGAGHRPQVM